MLLEDEDANWVHVTEAACQHDKMKSTVWNFSLNLGDLSEHG